jgi:thimet oligopeptidase
VSAALLATATPDELTRAAEAAIAGARADIERLVAGAAGGAGEAVLEAFDEATARLRDAIDLAELVAKAHPDGATRAAAEGCQQALDKVATDISLDRRVYDALAAVDLSGVDARTRHWVTRTLREFRRAGVDRDEATRIRLRELQEELVGIAQEFARNVNSDTRTAALPPSALDGLPRDYVRSHPPDEDGLVRISTDYPDVLPLLAYSRDATARERMWRLFRQRGHPANIDVLRRLLSRRHELATLLGYPSWAQYVTEDKMIGSEQAAADFIARISAAAGPRMSAEYAALLARKRADEPDATAVEPWDLAYLQDRVKEERFAFDSQAVRPYFEYGRVKAGLMAVAERLFGIEFRPRPYLPVWHADVEAYDVFEAGELLGRIFLDMHPRPDKFSHAAMFSMGTGKGGRRVPECALVCNLPKPGAGSGPAEPALLSHTNVVTLFHEFGHLLHHVFAGRQRWAGSCGVRTEWDFVEAPSQLLEEWTRDAATLASFAVHHGTGEPIPTELVAQLRAAEEFGKGLHVRQQMAYAALSLELYRRDPGGLDPLAVERETSERHTPFRHVADTYLHLSFGHLVGYSAAYYTYMWSLVIAKDLFTAFDPAALMAAPVAARYRRSVLAAGGSAPAAELIRDFLGREYNFDAYQAWLASG